MKKQQIKVKWVGPAAKIDPESNKDLLTLVNHKVLIKKFGKERIRLYEYGAKKLLNYVRALFKRYKLLSSYHDFGHNYVTTITSIRAYIGAIKLGKSFNEDDFRCLLIVSLFHDTGYLKMRKEKESVWATIHSKQSRVLMRKSLKDVILLNKDKFDSFLRDIGDYDPWKILDIEKIVDLQKFTNYSRWKMNKEKIKKNKIAQILVASDLMQVVDKNYFNNREALEVYIMSKKDKDHTKFYEFEKEGVKWIWKYLDAFYGAKNRNPYRKMWEFFKDQVL